MILPPLNTGATITPLITLGNANQNSPVLDLQTYKGSVTFLRLVGQSSAAAGNQPNCYLLDSADNSNFSAVSGGAFSAVGNTMNTANTGAESLSFDVRSLRRYVYIASTVLGTNPNIPLGIAAIGQKERI